MEKHTSGPWKVVSEEPYDLRIKAGPHEICEVWMDDAPVRDYNEEQRLNARLIAAAPDMLQLLRDAVEFLPLDNPTVHGFVDDAHKLIAKAVGR